MLLFFSFFLSFSDSVSLSFDLSLSCSQNCSLSSISFCHSIWCMWFQWFGQTIRSFYLYIYFVNYTFFFRTIQLLLRSVDLHAHTYIWLILVHLNKTKQNRKKTTINLYRVLFAPFLLDFIRYGIVNGCASFCWCFFLSSDVVRVIFTVCIALACIRAIWL